MLNKFISVYLRVFYLEYSCSTISWTVESRVLVINSCINRHVWFSYDGFDLSSTEQQYFEIEKRLSHSQERLVNETRECQNLRLELEKLSKYLTLTLQLFLALQVLFLYSLETFTYCTCKYWVSIIFFIVIFWFVT